MSGEPQGRGFRWQALLQRAEEALFVLDRRRRLLFVNRAWERLADIPAERARGLVCRRPRPTGPDDSAEEMLAHILTPPPEVHHGQFARARRMFLARGRPPAVPQWWDVEFFPLRQAGPKDGYLVLGRVLPLPVQVPAARAVLPERLEGLRVRHAARFGFELLASALPSMKTLTEQARLAAQVSAPLMICGERGSGKRTLARIVHHQGPGREGAFVSLDCRVLPTQSLADVLLADRGGGFWTELGTVYLAEPGRMPRDLQTRVCEWLATGKGPRLIAGSSRRSEGLVEELGWRLGTLVINVPPLRSRLDDLPRLAPAVTLTQAAREAFRAYPWPGNLAELRRVLQAARARAGGDRIDLADLPMSFREARLLQDEPGVVANSLPLEQALALAEEKLIRLALKRARGNRSRAAEMLGVHRPRLQRRMEALGIREPGEGE